MATNRHTNLVSNPLVINSPVSYKNDAAKIPGTPGTLRVNKILYFDLPAGASISVKDPASSEELWAATNPSKTPVNVESNFATPLVWNDFAVSSFSGGTLYIWHVN